MGVAARDDLQIHAEGTTSLKVFLSYSRKDEPFARELFAGLELCGFDPFIDKEDIAAGEDWEVRLTRLIERADTVVYVVSPNSISSERCGWEIDQSSALNKRVLPVVWQRVQDAMVPDKLRRLNYIYFDQPHSFGPSLARLATALRTDLDWLREHTRIGEQATDWNVNNRSEERLFRGEALASALAWLRRRPPNAPEPTELQRSFLAASEDAEAVRSALQERQLKEIADAQAAREVALLEKEAAQAKIARGQKRIGRLLVGVSCLLLALVGLFLRQQRVASYWEARDNTFFARAAFGEQKYDVAMQFALQGLPAKGSIPLLTYESPELESKLAGAAQMSRTLAVLAGHDGIVRHAVFDDRSERVATASQDGFARVWVISNPERPKLMLRHNDEVNSVEFSADGTRLVTASSDGNARLWNLTHGTLVATLPHQESVVRATFDRGSTRILTVSQDQTARLWDGATGKLLKIYRGHENWVQSGEFSSDGKLVLTASTDGTARIWSTEGPESDVDRPVATLRDGQSPLASAHFDRSSTQVLTASNDTIVRLWDIDSVRVVQRFKHEGGVFRAVFSADERRIATASQDGKARIFAIADGEVTNAFEIDRLTIGDDRPRFPNSIAFVTGDTQLAGAPTDGELRIWDIGNNQTTYLRGHTEEIFSVAASLDGRMLVTASGDKTARVWSARGAEVSRVPAEAIAWMPDSKTAALLSTDGRFSLVDGASGSVRSETVGPANHLGNFGLPIVGDRVLTVHREAIEGAELQRRTTHVGRLWSTADGKVQREFRGHSAPLTSIAFYGGDRVLTTSQDGTARLWDTQSDRVQTLDGHAGPVRGACMAPRHGLIVTFSDGGTTFLWKVTGNERSQPFPVARRCAINFEQSRLILELYDNTLTQWELPSLRRLPSPGKLERSLTNGQKVTRAASTLSFDARGENLLVGLSDGALLLNSLQTGSTIQTFAGTWLDDETDADDRRRIRSAQMSANGRRVVSVSTDEVIRIWDVASGLEVATLKGRSASFESAAVGLSDTRLVTSSAGVVRVWDVEWAMSLSGDELRSRVCARKIGGFAAQPCTRRGPLSGGYWTGMALDALAAITPGGPSSP